MDLVYIPAMLSVIFLINLIYLIKNNKFAEMKYGKLGLIVYISVTIMFSSYLIDLFAFLGHQASIYQLPSRTGTISTIRINDKMGAPSKLFIGGKEFEVDKKLVNKRKFYRNRRYKVIYTPINKVIYRIIDLDKVNF